MRVNRSRLVNTPDSTIASYWSTVNRAKRFGTHLDREGCLVIVDMVVSPSVLAQLYCDEGAHDTP